MTSTSPISKAKDLQSLILEYRDETEASRQLPQAIVQALIDAQLHRIALPKEADGLELLPLEAFKVYETLAKAEASVAWIMWNNSLPCYLARFLSSEVRDEIFDDPSILYASSTRPSGTAEKDGDSYSLNGRWSMVSGCMHATWVAVMCKVTEGGEPNMIRPGVPNMRLFYLPRNKFERLDTWHVGGLRGSGSHDLILKDEAASHARSVSFMDRPKFTTSLGKVPVSLSMSAGSAAICLGIASVSLDTLVELSKTKVSPDPGPDLKDRPGYQATVAQLSSAIENARNNLYSSYEIIWQKLEAGNRLRAADVAPVWTASVNAALSCRSAVTDIYAAAGATALYTNSPIERAHRDIHAVCQHVVIQPFWLEEAARVFEGLKPTHPLFLI